MVPSDTGGRRTNTLSAIDARNQSLSPQRWTELVGGAVITEFKVEVPGNYILVDHALARAERGLVGILHVEGARPGAN